MMFFACNKSLKFLHPSVGVSGCQVGWSRRSPGWPCATHGRCGEFGLGVWGLGSRRDHPMVGGERWREGVVSLLSLVVMYKCIDVYCIVFISQGFLKILFIFFLSWLWVWWGSDESLWVQLRLVLEEVVDCLPRRKMTAVTTALAQRSQRFSKLVESPLDLLIVEFLKEIPNNQFFYGICG